MQSPNRVAWAAWISPGIVVVYALLQGGTGYAITAAISATLAPGWAQILAGAQFLATAGVSLALWALMAGVVHGTALLIGGEGEYRPLAFLWGYGYITQVLAGAITFLVLRDALPVLSRTAVDQHLRGVSWRLTRPCNGWQP